MRGRVTQVGTVALLSIVMAAGSALAAYTLTLSPSGSGGGSVNSIPSGTIACTYPPQSGTCSATLPAGSVVSLVATPGYPASFTGWSGSCASCNGEPSCAVTLAGDKSCVATFTAPADVMATVGSASFVTLQGAFNAAPNSSTVRAREGSFPESLTLARPVTVFLRGGLDPSFATRTGYSVLHGRCNVRAGALVADGLAISYAQEPPPAPVSIAVTPQKTVVTGSLQFFASATLSNGSSADVSSSVVWSSSDSAIATVSATGIVTATGQGSVTIKATSGSLSGSTVAIMNPLSSPNEMAVSVNGSLCSPATSAGYFNKPCASITICAPGTMECQTIGDILLDSGSYGLRIFGSAISVPLPQSQIGSRDLAECVGFADGTTAWGPVKMADVVLGGEAPVRVPIQVLDSSFGNSSVCGVPDASPAAAGFHGILGVGVFAEDCGPGCANSAFNGLYYTCAGTSCTGAAVPLASQVQNPVSALPANNNGIIVKIPAVPASGATSVTGTILLGIGTRANNTPAFATTLDLSTSGSFPSFYTTISGKSYSSFLDTGSNGIFLPQGGNLVPACRDGVWLCPPATTSLQGTATSGWGSGSAPLSFDIANTTSIFGTGNQVFGNLGGINYGPEIDFGLPFFFGRDVLIGYDGKSSPFGTGAYWGE